MLISIVRQLYFMNMLVYLSEILVEAEESDASASPCVAALSRNFTAIYYTDIYTHTALDIVYKM